MLKQNYAEILFLKKMKNDRLTKVLSRSTATDLNEWLYIARIILVSHTAQSTHKCSACFNTVSVAFSCLSGG